MTGKDIVIMSRLHDQDEPGVLELDGKPFTFLAIDPASRDGDFTGVCAMVNGKIVDAFTIPGHRLVIDEPEPSSREMREKFRQHLENLLAGRHVGEVIISRCLRLNPIWQEGTMPRGIRRSDHNSPALWEDAMPKGKFLRQYGRAAFDAIPHAFLHKRGRRRWVSRNALRGRIWEFYLGQRTADAVTVQETPGFWDDHPRLRAVLWPEFAKMMGFPAES